MYAKPRRYEKRDPRQVPLRRNNTTGYNGIHLERDGRYKALIRVDGVLVFLGRFKDIEDAIEARKMAEDIYWGEQ